MTENKVRMQEGGRLSLAYRELRDVPRAVRERFAEKVRFLDLSHNEMESLRSVKGFSALETLIVDNNKLSTHVTFPFLPSLQTLWVNHNQIGNLSLFIERVAQSFPNLTHLSMWNNEAAPSYFNGGTLQQYTDFRYYVIAQLPQLASLDDTVISEEERAAAKKVYKTRRHGSVQSKEGRSPRKSTSTPSSRKSSPKQERSATAAAAPSTPAAPTAAAACPVAAPAAPPPPAQAPPPPAFQPPPPQAAAPPAASAPPSGSGTPGRGALLSSIRQGAKLKKATTNDRSNPNV